MWWLQKNARSTVSRRRVGLRSGVFLICPASARFFARSLSSAFSNFRFWGAGEPETYWLNTETGSIVAFLRGTAAAPELHPPLGARLAAATNIGLARTLRTRDARTMHPARATGNVKDGDFRLRRIDRCARNLGCQRAQMNYNLFES